MLSTDSPNTDGKPAEALRARSAPPPLPLLCSIKRACVEWGDCGKTRFYEIAREHGVELMKIGSKTVVAGEDVKRVAEAILAAARNASFDARALAAKSVAARKRHGSAPASSPSAATSRRRRRGSTAT